MTGICNAAGCGATIRWVITEGGRRLPIDPDPNPHGNIIAVPQPDGTVRARVLTGAQMPAQETAWMPHWNTCTAPPQFRPRTRRGPRCTVCRQPMDPDLAHREAWTTHPACDPRGHRPPRRTA